MNQENSENYYTVGQVAKILNVPKSFIYSRTRTGEIPHYKLGKYCRFDPPEIFEWIRKQKAGR